MNYVLYNEQTGEIQISGVCHDEDFELQLRDGLSLMKGFGAYETHYVSEGQIVAYTPEQVSAKASRPSSFHRWSNKTLSWKDSRTQEQIAMGQATEARAKRDKLLAESDWTDTLSAKSRLGDSLYQAWQDYRQALRDISSQPGFPANVIWPKPPQ